MRLHRTIVAVAVALLAGPLLVTGAAQAAPAGEGKTWSPALLSSEPLYDGSAVRLRYTEGITVVASAGATVIFTGSRAVNTTADARRIYDRAVQIVDPHGIDRSPAAAA